MDEHRIGLKPIVRGIWAPVGERPIASLPHHAWRTITWRDGSADKLTSRFARVRVRTAPIRGAANRPEETLLIEWPPGDAALFAKPAVSSGYRPRGAADQAATPCPQLNRHHASNADHSARSHPAAMPLLRSQIPAKPTTQFMTQ
jgi:hypothetical protein